MTNALCALRSRCLELSPPTAAGIDCGLCFWRFAKERPDYVRTRDDYAPRKELRVATPGLRDSVKGLYRSERNAEHEIHGAA